MASQHLGVSHSSQLHLHTTTFQGFLVSQSLLAQTVALLCVIWPQRLFEAVEEESMIHHAYIFHISKTSTMWTALPACGRLSTFLNYIHSVEMQLLSSKGKTC